MTLQVRIRPATTDDIPTILSIEQAASTASHWTREHYERLFERGLLLVAEVAETLCGFICGQAAADEWELANVVVAEEFRRRGIAEKLVRSLIQHALAGGAAAIFLEARDSNQAARALYQKLGFAETGRRRAYYSNPREDAILYVLALGSPPRARALSC